MKLIRGWHNLRRSHHGCVATIGNFDGVHLGHQAIFERLGLLARRWALPSVVIMFEPQPAEYFAPETAPSRLTRLREKLQAIERCEVDLVQCLRFGAGLANMSADRFVSDILVQGLGVRHLAVGDDFRFGAGRRGDYRALERAGRDFGFEVEDTPTVAVGGERVSSTRVRTALQNGRLSDAERLLGRRYGMSGRVVHGEQLGRTLGFPTANISLHRRVSPLRGVFAVTVWGAGHGWWQGVANVGCRPTVAGSVQRLEVHLLDFAGDLYGHHLDVKFMHRIRDELRFQSLDALRAQIQHDVRTAEAWFEGNGYQDLPTIARPPSRRPDNG